MKPPPRYLPSLYLRPDDLNLPPRPSPPRPPPSSLLPSPSRPVRSTQAPQPSSSSRSCVMHETGSEQTDLNLTLALASSLSGSPRDEQDPPTAQQPLPQYAALGGGAQEAGRGLQGQPSVIGWHVHVDPAPRGEATEAPQSSEQEWSAGAAGAPGGSRRLLASSSGGAGSALDSPSTGTAHGGPAQKRQRLGTTLPGTSLRQAGTGLLSQAGNPELAPRLRVPAFSSSLHTPPAGPAAPAAIAATAPPAAPAPFHSLSPAASAAAVATSATAAWDTPRGGDAPVFKRYKCSVCGREFDKPQALGGHMSTHRGVDLSSARRAQVPHLHLPRARPAHSGSQGLPPLHIPAAPVQNPSEDLGPGGQVLRPRQYDPPPVRSAWGGGRFERAAEDLEPALPGMQRFPQQPGVHRARYAGARALHGEPPGNVGSPLQLPPLGSFPSSSCYSEGNEEADRTETRLVGRPLQARGEAAAAARPPPPAPQGPLHELQGEAMIVSEDIAGGQSTMPLAEEGGLRERQRHARGNVVPGSAHSRILGETPTATGDIQQPKRPLCLARYECPAATTAAAAATATAADAANIASADPNSSLAEVEAAFRARDWDFLGPGLYTSTSTRTETRPSGPPGNRPSQNPSRLAGAAGSGNRPPLQEGGPGGTGRSSAWMDFGLQGCMAPHPHGFSDEDHIDLGRRPFHPLPTPRSTLLSPYTGLQMRFWTEWISRHGFSTGWGT